MASNSDLVSCTNFGPLAAGSSASYTLDDKFAVGTNLKVLMFSSPVALFDGPVPSTHTVTLTIPAGTATGHHKFIQYGLDSSGAFRVGGCATDVVAPSSSTTNGGTYVAGTTQTNTATTSTNTVSAVARTGAQTTTWVTIASALMLLGSAALVLGNRRRRQQ